MAAGDPVNLVEGTTPSDYHCQCKFCSKVIGELRAPDGSYYSRLERRQYYSKAETAKTSKDFHNGQANEEGNGGHIAKTPLHIARWAVQRYSQPGDWVLDPTMGAGTTAVESLTQDRNVAGMELQFGDVLKENVKLHSGRGSVARLRIGDARNIGSFLEEVGQQFSLIVNNPPYSGDESQKGIGKTKYSYRAGLPNLAFLKERDEYWQTLKTIYADSVKFLKPGGHVVIGVKDMMKNKEPFKIHEGYCKALEEIGLEFVGTAFLKHYPQTQFLNTYYKAHGAHPPYYQTISVFQKAT